MKYCPSMNTPYDDEGPCEVCHRDTASCECPECPECGEHGNPKCAINQWKPDTPIRNINDLATMIGTSVEGIKKALYKGTDCGIIFAEKDFNTVTVCGYAEGADAECMDHDLVYPFTADEFWTAVQQADDEGCEMWHEWNDEPDEEITVVLTETVTYAISVPADEENPEELAVDIYCQSECPWSDFDSNIVERNCEVES
jgi:hypothetical protein